MPTFDELSLSSLLPLVWLWLPRIPALQRVATGAGTSRKSRQVQIEPPGSAGPRSSGSFLDQATEYVRPTERQKLHAFESSMRFGPYAIAAALIGGGIRTGVLTRRRNGEAAAGAFPEQRVANNFGIQLGYSDHALRARGSRSRGRLIYYHLRLHERFSSGFSHAVISTVTARRGEDGHATFSLSGLVSPYAGTMTALAWYPSRFGVKDGFRMGNYNLLDQAAKNVAFEFIYGGPHALLGRNHVSSFGRP